MDLNFKSSPKKPAMIRFIGQAWNPNNYEALNPDSFFLHFLYG